MKVASFVLSILALAAGPTGLVLSCVALGKSK